MCILVSTMFDGVDGVGDVGYSLKKGTQSVNKKEMQAASERDSSASQ